MKYLIFFVVQGNISAFRAWLLKFVKNLYKIIILIEINKIDIERMKNMKQILKKLLKKAAIQAIEKDMKNTCTFGLYQPASPKNLKKKCEKAKTLNILF